MNIVNIFHYCAERRDKSGKLLSVTDGPYILWGPINPEMIIGMMSSIRERLKDIKDDDGKPQTDGWNIVSLTRLTFNESTDAQQ